MSARHEGRSDDEDYVRVNVDILRVSDGAVHCRCGDNIARWIPRSLIFGPDEKRIVAMIGEMTAIKVMRWFAAKEAIPIATLRESAP